MISEKNLGEIMMDFYEATQLFKDYYIHFNLDLVKDRENELLFSDRSGSQIIVSEEDINKFLDVENSKDSFGNKPTECSICSKNYREQMLDYQKFYLGFGYNNERFIFGNENGEKMYGEIGLASDTFVNFFRFNEISSEHIHLRLRRGFLHGFYKNKEKEEPIHLINFLRRPITIKIHNIKAHSIYEAIKESNPVVDACLFELAYLKEISLQIAEEWEKNSPRRHPFRFSDEYKSHNLPLRSIKYNSDVLRFYSRGTSTEDPVNQFLSFYHVLEYFFISVSDEQLYSILSRRINDPIFSTTPNHLDRLIHDTLSYEQETDETKMLKLVLEKFVDKEEIIRFIKEIEEYENEKFYTKQRKIFGKEIEVKPESGHVIANLATRIKTIRNALVHSSDKFERKARYVPTGSSEKMINKEIPLMKYLAEKVIIGSADD